MQAMKRRHRNRWSSDGFQLQLATLPFCRSAVSRAGQPVSWLKPTKTIQNPLHSKPPSKLQWLCNPAEFNAFWQLILPAGFIWSCLYLLFNIFIFFMALFFELIA